MIAQSVSDAEALWAIRECTADFPVKLDPVNSDVSLPKGVLGEFVECCCAALDEKWQGFVSYFFGHIGDSNLHLTVDGRSVPDVSHQAIYAFVYQLLKAYGGSVSAEHGIGLLKREFLAVPRSDEEVATMMTIKAALDPNGILNPSKVI